MVLPWLVVGASAALEASRRSTPASQREREIKRLRNAEETLKDRKNKLAEELQKAVSVLSTERRAHEADKLRMSDMDRIHKEIETRVMQLQEMTEELVKENEQLKVDKSLLEEEALHAHKENQELKNEAQLLKLHNSQLEDKVQRIQEETQAEVEQAMQLMSDLKSAVADALVAFTSGGPAVEFQHQMEKLGIKMDCHVEDLQRISESATGREALQDVVTEQFNSQMSLVMEDRGRLEHLMGIAQGLRLKHSDTASNALFEKPNMVLSTHERKVPEHKSVNLTIGTGLISNLSHNAEAATDAAAALQHNSMPSANSILLEQDLLNQKAQELTLKEEKKALEAPVKKSTEKRQKGQKSFFNFHFKGLPEKKQQRQIISRPLSSMEDNCDFGGAGLVRK